MAKRTIKMQNATYTIELQTVSNAPIVESAFTTIAYILHGELPPVETCLMKMTDSPNGLHDEDCEILANMLLFMTQAEVNQGFYCVDCCKYFFHDLPRSCVEAQHSFNLVKISK